MSGLPKVSVVMSVYNGEKYLRATIESILNQTLTNFEFLIFDDCSSDSTADIVKSFNDPRIKYIRNIENNGLTKNLITGVEMARAPYIVRIDADDIAYPERFEKQVEWMDDHPEISILGTPVSYFTDDLTRFNNSVEPISNEEIKALLFVSFTLKHPSIIIRKSHLEQYGLNYNAAYRCSQDHALYFDCIVKGLKFANLDEPLLYMRSHAESISMKQNSMQAKFSEQARRRFLEKTGIAEGCSDSEISAFIKVTRRQPLQSRTELKDFERFVDKIYGNPRTSVYFDIIQLRRVIANEIIGQAYEMASVKRHRGVAYNIRQLLLAKYADRWSAKQWLKFYIKIMIAR